MHLDAVNKTIVDTLYTVFRLLRAIISREFCRPTSLQDCFMMKIIIGKIMCGIFSTNQVGCRKSEAGGVRGFRDHTKIVV